MKSQWKFCLRLNKIQWETNYCLLREYMWQTNQAMRGEGEYFQIHALWRLRILKMTLSDMDD